MIAGHYYGGAFVKGNQMAGPSVDCLLAVGGNDTHLVRDEFQYWRLVSCVFLHAGVIHLASNLFFTSQFAYSWELRWGSLNIGLIYIISGITGSMLSCIGSPSSVSVGASGSLAGLIGADLVYLYLNWNLIPMRDAHCELCFVSGVILLNLMMAGSEQIDSYGHFGGLIGGAVCAFSLVKLLRPEEEPNKDLYRRVGW
eukprot:CAMPEP_0197522258 /NCGR_PEP_ID=MMETSP1318-20131121/7445_1 /TAXON_ID=552666 /ORGANISM="Partenskyella glossopodia, Strain RCC365" /LENGTH=197 /DNA_ID=CAMNT_0043074581 /DNA_START=172 /DNA_END=762 /DNA_ORIENTATION=+